MEEMRKKEVARMQDRDRRDRERNESNRPPAGGVEKYTPPGRNRGGPGGDRFGGGGSRYDDRGGGYGGGRYEGRNRNGGMGDGGMGGGGRYDRDRIGGGDRDRRPPEPRNSRWGN